MSTPEFNKTESENSLVISFLSLRRLIGYLGIGLPLILIVGSVLVGDCKEIQPSISAYYHTIMRDIFVAVISMIAIFLFSYKGYDSADRISCKLAALFAMGVALFPTEIGELTPCVVGSGNDNELIGHLHLFFACSFFLMISFISIYLFTKTDKATPSKEKRTRNKIYKGAGYLIIGCLIGIGVYWWVVLGVFPDSAKLKPVFFFEAFALLAFGVSWLIKGQFLLRDSGE